MIETIVRHILPASYSLLPAKMNSLEASAMLVAIGLQETRFLERKQRDGGPARGFWQFEPGATAALAGVLTHKQTKEYARLVLERSVYALPVITDRALRELCEVLAHNDVVAGAFARLLLWTVPEPLPARDDREEAWRQYLEAWRPGAPHPETWKAMHEEAWYRLTLDPEVSSGNLGGSRFSPPEGDPPRPGDSRGHARHRHPFPTAQTRRH